MSQSKSGTRKPKRASRIVSSPVGTSSASAEVYNLKQRVTALEAALQRLSEVLQHNNGLYAQAFHLQDGHLWVLRKIHEDTEAGDLKLDKNGKTDFTRYYTEFNAFMEARFKQTQQAPAEEPSEPTDPPVVEFGGDTHVSAS
jgi:hypothetical protein